MLKEKKRKEKESTNIYCGHYDPDTMWYYFQISVVFYSYFKLNINQFLKLVFIIKYFATY